MTLTFGSLFAGIGGFDLGFERAGMRCLWQVEYDKKCQDVLRKHFDAEVYNDVREVGKHNLAPVDVICGGFPCQDVSLAGQRAGLEGKRSTLWTEFNRIIGEIKPRWIVVENVRGLFTSNSGQFFGNILRDLASGGYDAEWDCLPAAFFGAPQLRHRVFIIAYPSGNIGRGTRFFDIQSKDRTNLGEYRRPPSKVIWNGLQIDRKRPSTYLDSFPEPIFLRMDNGLSDGMDKSESAVRMKQSGNAVVPQIAEWIGQRIVDHDTDI